MGKPKGGLPVVRQAIAVDLGRPIREWWRTHKPEDSCSLTTLAGAMSDVGILSLRRLARRLEDRKTPDKVKDQIALAMAPRLIAEVRGRVAGAGRRTEAQVVSGPAPGMQELLGSYGIETTKTRQ